MRGQLDMCDIWDLCDLRVLCDPWGLWRDLCDLRGLWDL